MKLVVDGLTKTFGERTAVDQLSFEIESGETYGLLGPNGAGKTTAILMTCGLLKADGGLVKLGDQEVTPSAVQVRHHIGFVPQEIAIYEDLSARENLHLFGRLHGLSGSTLNSRIDTVLEILGLTSRASDRTEQFSGGMQRRLNIGMGLIHEPDLLVLDEPTVGVDPQSRNAILDAVELLSAEGMAMLYTTHYMEEAERLCDRVGIMDEGQLIAEGTRRELVGKVGQQDRIRLELTRAVDPAVLEVVPGVEQVAFAGPKGDVYVNDATTSLPQVLSELATAGSDVRSVEIIEPDLEAVFLHLTGKALRDD